MDLRDWKTGIHKFLNRNFGTILTYHSIVDVPLPFAMWTHLPLRLFAEHMALLREEANVLSLQEMTLGILSGKLPKYSVAVTFDDGFRNNFTRAYPILKRYGIPATVFLSTGYMDHSELFWPERIAYQLMRTERRFLETTSFGHLCLDTGEARRAAFGRIKNAIKEMHPYMIPEKVDELEKSLGVAGKETDPLFQEWLPLTWQDVKDMETDGLVSFGGHTVSHAILTRLDDTQALREIVDCRSALDGHLARRSEWWAHPNGTRRDFNARHIEMLRANSFQTILTAEPGHFSHQSDIAMLPRVGVSHQMDACDIKEILAKKDHLERQRGGGKKSPAWAGLWRGSIT